MDCLSEGPVVDIVHVSSLMYPVSCIPSHRHCHVDHVPSTQGLVSSCLSIELTHHCCHMKSHRNLSYNFCHICTVHYLIHCNNYLSKTPLAQSPFTNHLSTAHLFIIM